MENFPGNTGVLTSPDPDSLAIPVCEGLFLWQVLEVKPNKAKIGKDYKKEGKPLQEALDKLSQEDAACIKKRCALALVHRFSHTHLDGRTGKNRQKHGCCVDLHAACVGTMWLAVSWGCVLCPFPHNCLPGLVDKYTTSLERVQ